jgi:hypothetical protein
VTWRHNEGVVPMSLQAPIIYCQREDTVRVAPAAFPRSNTYMRIDDALGPIYSNPQFARLFPRDGQPALAPAQLALVTVFQFVEGLSDRQAADAVRGRIDWKFPKIAPTTFLRFLSPLVAVTGFARTLAISGRILCALGQ